MLNYYYHIIFEPTGIALNLCIEMLTLMVGASLHNKTVILITSTAFAIDIHHGQNCRA